MQVSEASVFSRVPTAKSKVFVHSFRGKLRFVVSGFSFSMLNRSVRA